MDEIQFEYMYEIQRMVAVGKQAQSSTLLRSRFSSMMMSFFPGNLSVISLLRRVLWLLQWLRGEGWSPHTCCEPAFDLSFF
jgi:hypothetical protein